MDENISKNPYTLMDIFEKISNLTTQVKLLHQEQKNFGIILTNLKEDYKEIKEKISKYDKRFDKIDNLAAYKGSWLKGFERNWWRILIVITPVCIGLFEAAVWLKNLPVPSL